MDKNLYKNNFITLAILPGVYLFVCLYVIATAYYPGGSQVNLNSTGFSWANNYWCNLINENAMNGQRNPSRPIALTAMFILFVSLCGFWYVFPKYVELKKSTALIIRATGLLSMLSASFIFTEFHDISVNFASFFGIIAIAGTLVGLYRSGRKKLFLLGIFNLVLIVFNNIFYYTSVLRIHLPMVQKISFFFFLLWLCLVSISLYCKEIKIRQPLLPGT